MIKWHRRALELMDRIDTSSKGAVEQKGPSPATPQGEESGGESIELQALWNRLGELDKGIAAETPSPEMAIRFRHRLSAAIASARAPEAESGRRGDRRLALCAVGATLLLCIGIVMVQHVALPPERAAHETGVPAATIPASLTDRLEAVLASAVPETPLEDARPVLARALSDFHPSVRLAAIEAMARRLDGEALAGELGSALRREGDPLVRVALIHAIGKRRLLAAASSLRALDLDPNLDDITRFEVRRALRELST